MLGHASGKIGASLIFLLLIVALGAPILAPYNPIAQDFEPLQTSSVGNLLGTDEFGRDILSRIIFGARISLEVGVIAVAVALIIGGSIGLISGYYSGFVDSLFQRVIDIMLSIPSIVLIIAISGVVGPSTTTAMIAIGIVYAPSFARVIRGSTLYVRELLFVDVARSIGAKTSRIIIKHVLPNVIAPMIVQATLSFSTAILAEATLSFLGLGTQPPNPSWGSMLSSGRKYIELAPALTIFPGLAIMLAVLGLIFWVMPCAMLSTPDCAVFRANENLDELRKVPYCHHRF